MDKTREKHLEEIGRCVERIELDLIKMPDSEDLEFKWDELVAKLEDIQGEVTVTKDYLEGVMDRFELEYELHQLAFHLEEVRDEMRELKDEVADVKSQMDDLGNGDWP